MDPRDIFTQKVEAAKRRQSGEVAATPVIEKQEVAQVKSMPEASTFTPNFIEDSPEAESAVILDVMSDQYGWDPEADKTEPETTVHTPNQEVEDLRAQLQALQAQVEQANAPKTPSQALADLDADVEDYMSLLPNFAELEHVDEDVATEITDKLVKPILAQMSKAHEKQLKAQQAAFEEKLKNSSEGFSEVKEKMLADVNRDREQAFVAVAGQKLSDHVPDLNALLTSERFKKHVAENFVKGTRVPLADALYDAYQRGDTEDFSHIIKQVVPKARTLGDGARPNLGSRGVSMQPQKASSNASISEERSKIRKDVMAGKITPNDARERLAALG